MIAIILCNLYAMSQINLSYENLSYFSILHQHGFLFLWGSLNASWFFYTTNQIFHYSGYTSKKEHFILILSTLMLFISVLLPYQPDTYPTLSQLHILCSFLGTITYAFLLLWFHYYLSLFYPKINQKGFIFYLTLMFFCLLQYITYGCVNGYMECGFSIGMCFYLNFLLTSITSHQ